MLYFLIVVLRMYFNEKYFFFNDFVTDKMNENELYIVNEDKFDNQLIIEIHF